MGGCEDMSEANQGASTLELNIRGRRHRVTYVDQPRVLAQLRVLPINYPPLELDSHQQHTDRAMPYESKPAPCRVTRGRL